MVSLINTSLVEERTLKKNLSVAKIGGSLLDVEGNGIPKILKRILELKAQDGLGPIVVFSAPTGCTDELIRIGESCAKSSPLPLDRVFGTYEKLAKRHVKDEFLHEAHEDIARCRKITEAALSSVNKRFSGSVKAKLLAYGGEVPTALLMRAVIKSADLDCAAVPEKNWPLITDDNFEDASLLYEASKRKIDVFAEPLEKGQVVSMAGFLGNTVDGLETVLGRGGSDLTAVFVSCLLKSRYFAETLLFKDVPVLSADPKVVKGQRTEHVVDLTYNEAHKASMMGMKIVQGPAIAMARRFGQPLKVVPIDKPEKCTIIHATSSGGPVVKCLTGKAGCAILSMLDEKSRSLEDTLRIWERRNDFIDLGAETLETGDQIRDLLFLDSEFLRKNDEKLKGFDENMKVEYGLGVVTLVGDKMRSSPGVASLAISAIHGINIKRGILAPHTSQIIIVLEEKMVKPAVAAIHSKIAELNSLPAA